MNKGREREIMGKMRSSKRWLSKLLAFAAAISLMAPAARPAGAVTDISQREFDEIVSRYTDGQLTLDAFLREMDQKINMIVLEGR